MRNRAAVEGKHRWMGGWGVGERGRDEGGVRKGWGVTGDEGQFEVGGWEGEPLGGGAQGGGQSAACNMPCQRHFVYVHHVVTLGIGREEP